MINECIEPVRTINVDYTLEEDIQNNKIFFLMSFYLLIEIMFKI